jgi:two-component system sensor histidine kinase GlrK
MLNMTLYPRSFLRLILIGWLLVALPLLAAIGFAWHSLEGIAERGDAVVEQAALVTRIGWEMPEHLTDMERKLMQFELLHNPELLDDYADERLAWRQQAADLARIPMAASLIDRMTGLLGQEEIHYRRVQTNPRDTPALRDALGQIRVETASLLDELGQKVQAERDGFRAATGALRQRLLAGLGVAFLLAALLFWLGRRLLARLLSRFERAVVALGQNRLNRRIRLRGPQDLQWVGSRLDWLRRRLLALEEQRTRILRHVSHELKTPLAALREGTSLLHEGIAGPLSPQQARIANIMQGNVLRLQSLIDGLLKMQQAGHLRDRIELMPLRLDELIQQILLTHQLATRNKHLRVSGTLAPLMVAGGKEELTTVLDNLIANAIKFSPSGRQIVVNVSRNGELAVVDVIDEGPGIAEEDRDRIFEPFFRSPAAREVSGVGLGLAIARELALAHQGQLDVMPGETGSHFRLVLPLAKVAS